MRLSVHSSCPSYTQYKTKSKFLFRSQLCLLHVSGLLQGLVLQLQDATLLGPYLSGKHLCVPHLGGQSLQHPSLQCPCLLGEHIHDPHLMVPFSLVHASKVHFYSVHMMKFVKKTKSIMVEQPKWQRT